MQIMYNTGEIRYIEKSIRDDVLFALMFSNIKSYYQNLSLKNDKYIKPNSNPRHKKDIYNANNECFLLDDVFTFQRNSVQKDGCCVLRTSAISRILQKHNNFSYFPRIHL